MIYRFNIRDAKNLEILAAFKQVHGYQEFIPDGEGVMPNPESPHDFAERILKDIFIEPYVSARRSVAAQTEGDNARGDA